MKLSLKSLSHRYSDMSQARRSGFWFMVCNYITRATAFITVPVFTRLLTTSQYGLTNTYIAWFDIFVIFTSLNLPYEGLNNILIRWEDKKNACVSSIASLTVTLTALFSLVFLVFRKNVLEFTGLSPFLMAFMFVQLTFNPPMYIWINSRKFDFDYRKPVAVTVCFTLLSPLLSVLAIIYTPYKAEARIIALSSVQGLFGLIMYLSMLARGKTFFDREIWSFALRFNLPLLFYYLSVVVLNEADRVQIGKLCGQNATAIYSVAYSAAAIIKIGVTAISSSYHPWLNKKLKANDCDGISSSGEKLFLLVGVLCIVMSALAPDLVRLMATAEYIKASSVIPPVTASAYFIFVYQMLANVSLYFEKTRVISLISVIAAVLNVILNDIFIRKFGFTAAGWTTLASYLFLTVLHYLLYRKTIKHFGLNGRMFCEKRLLTLSAAVILGCCVMSLSYVLGAWRYAVALALIFAMLLAFGVIRKEVKKK